MIQIIPNNKIKCCGCSACAQICPTSCITMKEDEEGFLYPFVDYSKCVNCNRCEKGCPILQKDNLFVEDKNNIPSAIGGWIRDEKTRYSSSSGGAFSLFAEHILRLGGIVYGCSLTKELTAKHIGVEKIEELDKLRGSKYVQSSISEVYKEIRTKLETGRTVLFTGTPCQAAGLHSFLGRHYDNLYSCDFICHGVPSPKVFQSYIKLIEKKYNEKIIAFKFRNKDKGWKPSGLQMGNGTHASYLSGKTKRFTPGFRDHYMNGFLDDVYLRPSCYDCQFKCLPKYYSDITIADFWGVKKIYPKLYDGKGTSLILLNNEHGKKLFNDTKDNFLYSECDFSAAIKKNSSLIQSVAWNPRREAFFHDFYTKPFAKLEKKYMSAFHWASHKALKIGWSMLESIVIKIITPILKFFHISWNDKQWRDFMQFIKFSLVGVSNVIVSYLINVSVIITLRDSNLAYDYVIANITSFLLSVLWAYYWNDRFVFTVKTDNKRSKWKTLLKTYLSYGFTGIILNNVLSTIWIQGLGITKFISPLLNLPFSIPSNFIINKFWAFNDKQSRTDKVGNKEQRM